MADYTKKSWSETTMDLRACFDLWGVRDWGVDSALSPAKAARANQTEAERTVQIWFNKNGRDVILHISKWPRAVDNYRALYNVVDDLRLAEHRGVAEQMQSAYAQLAAPKDDVLLLGPVRYELAPRAVLGVPPTATVEEADAAYRELAKKYYPDNKDTGDVVKFREAAKAIEAIRRERHT